MDSIIHKNIKWIFYIGIHIKVNSLIMRVVEDKQSLAVDIQ